MPLLDTIQLLLECCGNESPMDWMNSTAVNSMPYIPYGPYPIKI